MLNFVHGGIGNKLVKLQVKKTMEESRLDQMVKNLDEKVRTGNLFTDVEKQFKQGYLWIKSKKGKWKKRYVSVINGRLLYYKSWKVMKIGGFGGLFVRELTLFFFFFALEYDSQGLV